ncbi:DUF58 domain-containing protein [Phragmitibacter flavus]|uniref:DUF58 domain-containing protein n=1 Tax=Phragmitibacter flavus TaxID=2576071 RepID=A0A5R8KGU6_9BACT|nr:DUF58 domain-containing protein [Phragmitibacter flavus]TLD71528.1 DUF58 domain-containing protein [Phragmitibacter flavus]
MPVPSNKLLIYTLVVGIPLFTLLGLMEVPLAGVVGIGVMLALVVAMDMPGAAASLRRLKVEVPKVIRTTKGRKFELPLVVVNGGMLAKRIKVGLPLPEEIDGEKSVLDWKLRNDDERNGTKWELLAVERGSFKMERLYFEGISGLGFWLGRRAIEVLVEVKVYPDLSHERSVLAPLFFRRGTIGVHQVRQIGKGREFEQLRAYAPGDGYEDVYWKGTAKRRFPVTKMFQLERTQEVYVAVDCSRRSRRRLEGLIGHEEAGMVAKTQLERYIQAALVLALAAQQQSDRFGLLVFSDKVQRVIPAGSGRAHYDVIRDVLYTLQAQAVSPDFDELFVQIGNRMRQRALLLILTDLGEPWLAESFVEGVSLVSRRHVVLTHMLGQKEVRPMFGDGDRVEDDDELYGRLAGQLMWNDLQETMRLLKQRGVHLTSSTQESLVADVVSEYLKVKKRQLI